uniref:C2H2-type domain-containing protein n=1 Tax=Stomoxys calcitrans TaxID=35570 RepID=A0A1I8PMF8_STOCA
MTLSHNIVKMLEYCTGGTLQDSNIYPPWICFMCIKQLEICFRFLKRYDLAQKEFEASHNQFQEESSDFQSALLDEDGKVEKRICHANLSTNAEFSETSISSKQNTLEPSAVQAPISEYSSSEGTTFGYRDSSQEPGVSLEGARNSYVDVVCSICNKTFLTGKGLNLHLKLYHKQKNISLGQ